ncbi:MAG TPA: NAD-dependent epimerase/dehydratase family protein [Ktedonobacterales bacterium]
MRILVTGVAGFIGTHLALALAQQGHSVVGLDCLTDYYSPHLKELNVSHLASEGIAMHRLDLAGDELSSAVDDVEVVFHLAAQPGLSAASFSSYERNNVVATYRLIDSLVGSTTLRAFIYISTSSVYGSNATGPETAVPEPISTYGVTKLAAEQLTLAMYRSRGFPACSFRLFSVYGPRERPDKLFPTLIRSIIDGTEFPLFAGSERHLRSYTYVGDIVNGLISSLDHVDECLGEIFNLGMDNAMTTGEGIRIVEEIMGSKARLLARPPRFGDQATTTANIEKARRVLGYHPTTGAREGLTRTVQWFTAFRDVYSEGAAVVTCSPHLQARDFSVHPRR